MMKLFLMTVMAMLALHNAKAIEINLKEEIKMEEKIMVDERKKRKEERCCKEANRALRAARA